MAENNIVLRKILAKECTQSLAFRDGVYSFAIREYIDYKRLHALISAKSVKCDMRLVNDILQEFGHLHTDCIKREIDFIDWSELLVGEVLEVDFVSEPSPVHMMKVASNVLLCPNGIEVNISNDFRLTPGASLTIDSNPHVINQIRLLIPNLNHAIFSDLHLSGYYRHATASDLRPIIAEQDCSKLLEEAKACGIGVFQLLNLLNLSCNELS